MNRHMIEQGTAVRQIPTGDEEEVAVERRFTRSLRMVTVGVTVMLIVALGAVGVRAETESFQDITVTFVHYATCVSDFPSLEGHEMTLTFSGVFHENENRNGAHFTFTNTGTLSAVPVFYSDNDGDDEPDVDEGTGGFVVAGPREGESFTGKFAIRGGGSMNRSGVTTFTYTDDGRATGDEGTSVQWHFNDHATAEGDPFEDPDAIVKVAFQKSRCY